MISSELGNENLGGILGNNISGFILNNGKHTTQLAQESEKLAEKHTKVTMIPRPWIFENFYLVDLNKKYIVFLGFCMWVLDNISPNGGWVTSSYLGQ